MRNSVVEVFVDFGDFKGYYKTRSFDHRIPKDDVSTCRSFLLRWEEGIHGQRRRSSFFRFIPTQEI